MHLARVLSGNKGSFEGLLEVVDVMRQIFRYLTFKNQLRYHQNSSQKLIETCSKLILSLFFFHLRRVALCSKTLREDMLLKYLTCLSGPRDVSWIQFIKSVNYLMVKSGIISKKSESGRVRYIDGPNVPCVRDFRFRGTEIPAGGSHFTWDTMQLIGALGRHIQNLTLSCRTEADRHKSVQTANWTRFLAYFPNIESISFENWNAELVYNNLAYTTTHLRKIKIVGVTAHFGSVYSAIRKLERKPQKLVISSLQGSRTQRGWAAGIDRVVLKDWTNSQNMVRWVTRGYKIEDIVRMIELALGVPATSVRLDTNTVWSGLLGGIRCIIRDTQELDEIHRRTVPPDYSLVQQLRDIVNAAKHGPLLHAPPSHQPYDRPKHWYQDFVIQWLIKKVDSCRAETLFEKLLCGVTKLFLLVESKAPQQLLLLKEVINFVDNNNFLDHFLWAQQKLLMFSSSRSSSRDPILHFSTIEALDLPPLDLFFLEPSLHIPSNSASDQRLAAVDRVRAALIQSIASLESHKIKRIIDQFVIPSARSVNDESVLLTAVRRYKALVSSTGFCNLLQDPRFCELIFSPPCARVIAEFPKKMIEKVIAKNANADVIHTRIERAFADRNKS